MYLYARNTHVSCVPWHYSATHPTLSDPPDTLRSTMRDDLRPIPAGDADLAARSLERDAARYRRLRVLGCAPHGSDQLDHGTVLRFQELDAAVDADYTEFGRRGVTL